MGHAAEYEDGDFGLEQLDEELAGLTAGYDGAGGERGHRDGAENGYAETRGPRERLLTEEETKAFRDRWAGVQAGFVEEPKRAVEQADHLVDQILKQLTADLRKERDALVRRWDDGHQDTSTEELRQALMGYRTLMDRLLQL